MKTIARGIYAGKEVDVPVINPGQWFGKTHLLVIDPCCYADPLLFCVEADHLSDALEEFVESEEGKIHCGIDIPVEGDDYGWEEATVNGMQKTTLKGNIYFPHEPHYAYVNEPFMSGDGTLADIDNVHHSSIENWDCKYFFPEGVDPTELF